MHASKLLGGCFRFPLGMLPSVFKNGIWCDSKRSSEGLSDRGSKRSAFRYLPRKVATPTIAQKVIQGRLNLLLYRIGAPVAHVGMLGIGFDDIDTVFPCLLDGRQYAGIGFEIRIL